MIFFILKTAITLAIAPILFVFRALSSVFGFFVKTFTGNIFFVIIGIFLLTAVPGCVSNISPLIRSSDNLAFESYGVIGKNVSSYALRGKDYILYFTKVKCGKCENLTFWKKLLQMYDIPLYAVIHSDDEVNMWYDGAEFRSVFTDIIVDDSLFRQAGIVATPHTLLMQKGNYIFQDISGIINQSKAGDIIDFNEKMNINKVQGVY